MALPVDRNTWQTDFSSLNRRYVYTVDNNGRHFLVDTRTKTRYEAGGQGQRAGIRAIWGEPVTGVFLTGYTAGPSVQDLYGGPNGIEQVVAGLRPDPLTGEPNPNPTAITSVAGIPYEPTPTPEPSERPETEPRNFFEELRNQYPHYPYHFLRAWADKWAETGDPNLALAEVRQDDRHDQWFPGIRRDDGSLRYSEEEYAQTERGFDQVFRQFGIDPRTMKSRYKKLFEGEKSADELHQDVAMTYQMVLSRGNDIKNYYVENFGARNISDGAILASAILGNDGEPVDPLVLEQRFRTAQVGGEFAATGFDMDLRDATRLAEFGLGQEAARKLARNARLQIPMLQALAERHNDPDDDLDLNEFLDAAAFQDPQQIERFERVLAQETSSFTPTSGTFTRERTGGVSGLVAR